MTASFTFTADSGTDVLTTSSAHGKATGDGPVCVRNVGGALPTGLSAITDYWLIVTGASTAKLATSSANALLGTAINITTNGTGTNYLEIGVPYRRPRTYAVGSQLKSADLNDNFDAWKAIYALLTGQTQSLWSNVTLATALNVSGVTTLSGDVDMASTAALALLGVVKLAGTISPSALSTGNVNDYNPTGLSTANVIRVTPAAGSVLTGLSGGLTGRVITLFNIGTDDLTITHEDTASAAGNRILLANATASVVVRDNGSVTLWYDTTSTRWRVLSQNL